MTWQQYGEAAYSMARKRLAGGEGPDYVPDFTRCVDHFAIHAGNLREAADEGGLRLCEVGWRGGFRLRPRLHALCRPLRHPRG